MARCLGGAHERAADDDSFAARRDVRELLFDVALVDGAVALQDALALGGAAFHNCYVATRRRRPHFCSVQAQRESRLRATRPLQVAAARGVLHA